VCILPQAFANLVRQEYFVKDVKKSLAAQQQHGAKSNTRSSNSSRTHAARARSASHTTAADGSSSSGAAGISVVKGMNLLPGDTYSFTKVRVVLMLLRTALNSQNSDSTDSASIVHSWAHTTAAVLLRDTLLLKQSLSILAVSTVHDSTSKYVQFYT
jgi:hypothetical protein